MMHDLPPLVLHLHLLLRIPIPQKTIHVRDRIERNLMRIHMRCRLQLRRIPRPIRPSPLPRLRRQFLNRLRPSPRHRLVTARKNPRNPERPMQRIQRHQRNRRRAVRIRNDPTVPGHIPGIDLRHHQRHSLIHPERRRIVHHHRPGSHRMRRKIPRNPPARTEQRNLHTSKTLRRQLPDRQFLTPKHHLLPRTPRTRQQCQAAHRKIPALQTTQHFNTHRSGGTHNG